jgi:hypothetical protein
MSHRLRAGGQTIQLGVNAVELTRRLITKQKLHECGLAMWIGSNQTQSLVRLMTGHQDAYKEQMNEVVHKSGGCLVLASPFNSLI